MPITKSAQKKMRQDKKRSEQNLKVKKAYKKGVKAFRKKPSKNKLDKTYSVLDKAAKKGVIKKGKASRLKSRLAKLVEKK